MLKLDCCCIEKHSFPANKLATVSENFFPDVGREIVIRYKFFLRLS